MSSIRSVALVSGAALLAAVLIAPPAAADRYTESDPHGDMAVDMPQTSGFSLAPTHHKLDIRHVIVRHTDHFVTIRAVVRHLTRPRGDESFSLFGSIKVNRRAQPSESVGWNWWVDFDESRPREGVRLFVLDAAYQEQFGCDGSVDEGFKARANYDRNRVTVIIPRGCLALDSFPNVRPQWVQVSVTTSHQLGLDRPWYFDNLGSQVEDPQYPTLSNSHFTPRLYPC